MADEVERYYGDPRAPMVFNAFGIEGKPTLDQQEDIFNRVWEGEMDESKLPEHAHNMPGSKLRPWAADIVVAYYKALRING